jgi:hypothetical protein
MPYAHTQISRCDYKTLRNIEDFGTTPHSSSPFVAVQNTIYGSTQSCSPENGHTDARNVLRQIFDNKHQISCILLVLSSPYFHDARSRERKIDKRLFAYWILS